MNENRRLRFCSLDFETGGLDPAVHALTQVGAVWFDFAPGDAQPNILRQSAFHLRPAPNLAVAPRALEVQGRSAASVFDPPEALDEDDGLVSFLVDHEAEGMPRFVVHRDDFEIGFFRAWATRCDRLPLLDSGALTPDQFVCSKRLVRFLRSVGAIPPGGSRLDDLAALFDLRRDRHDALLDAVLTAMIFVRLVEVARRFFGAGPEWFADAKPTPEAVLAAWGTFFGSWVRGGAYRMGALVEHDGRIWRNILAPRSTLTPPSEIDGWQIVEVAQEGGPTFTARLTTPGDGSAAEAEAWRKGATYKEGAVVLYDGRLWRKIWGGTSTFPPSKSGGWIEAEAPPPSGEACPYLWRGDWLPSRIYEWGAVVTFMREKWQKIDPRDEPAGAFPSESPMWKRCAPPSEPAAPEAARPTMIRVATSPAPPEDEFPPAEPFRLWEPGQEFNAHDSVEHAGVRWVLDRPQHFDPTEPPRPPAWTPSHVSAERAPFEGKVVRATRNVRLDVYRRPDRLLVALVPAGTVFRLYEAKGNGARRWILAPLDPRTGYPERVPTRELPALPDLAEIPLWLDPAPDVLDPNERRED